MIGERMLHYRIISKLSAGGKGEVYKAEDIKLKRPVALKFFPASFSSNEIAKKDLPGEAQIDPDLQNLHNEHRFKKILNQNIS